MLDEGSKRLTNWLLTALTAGFLAWAGVVWNASTDLSTAFGEMHADVREMAAEVRHLTTELNRHRAQPWHGRAGEEINRLRGGAP